MSYKNKEIDKLIADVLNERFEFDKDPDEPTSLHNIIKKATGTGYGFNTTSNNDVFNDIANKVTPPPDKLTDADLDYFLTNPGEADVDIQKRLVAIKRGLEAAGLHTSGTTKELYDKAEEVFQAINSAAQAATLRRQTATAPRLAPGKAAYTGGYTKELEAISNRFFSGSRSSAFVDRIKKVSEVSVRFFEASTGETPLSFQGNISEFLTEIMMLDIFNQIVKDFDAGSGGYLFEYFLAYISGGRITGKESGPGQGMGAIDFVSKTGIPGSSKYYAKASEIEQAPGGFDIGGKPVEYIIGLKKQDPKQVEDPKKGISDPSKIVAVDIYNVMVQRRTETDFLIYKKGQPSKGTMETFGFALDKNNDPIVDKRGRKKLSGKIVLTPFINASTFVSTIYISKNRTETYREMIEGALSDLNPGDRKRKAAETMIAFYDNLQNAEESSKVYTASGDMQSGVDTLNAIEQADILFEDLMALLDYDETAVLTGYADQKAAVTENDKKTLDKLIEAVILKSTVEGK